MCTLWWLPQCPGGDDDVTSAQTPDLPSRLMCQMQGALQHTASVVASLHYVYYISTRDSKHPPGCSSLLDQNTYGRAVFYLNWYFGHIWMALCNQNMAKLSKMGFEITIALVRLIWASCTFPPCAAIGSHASSSSVALLVPLEALLAVVLLAASCLVVLCC